MQQIALRGLSIEDIVLWLRVIRSRSSTAPFVTRVHGVTEGHPLLVKNLLHALPDTALHARLLEAGRIIKDDTGNNTDKTMNFVPTMEIETLMKGYTHVLHSIFSTDNYYRRVITYLREYHKVADGMKMSLRVQAVAFSRTIWRLGIREKGSRHFWKLMVWTAFRKPRLFPEAITQAIYGYHFRKVLIAG